MSLSQVQLEHMRIAGILGKGMRLSDVEDAPAEQMLDTYRTMAVGMLALINEVERLNRGLQAARGPLEEIKRAGDESVKDPSLSWYEDDRHHDKKVEFGSEAEDILHAIDRAMDE